MIYYQPQLPNRPAVINIYKPEDGAVNYTHRTFSSSVDQSMVPLEEVQSPVRLNPQYPLSYEGRFLTKLLYNNIRFRI